MSKTGVAWYKLVVVVLSRSINIDTIKFCDQQLLEIQADIFDYVFASLHMFDLKAFQAITGRINNQF